MTIIQRHQIDEELSRGSYEFALEGLPTSLANARQVPRILTSVVSDALSIVAEGSVVAPKSPDIILALRLAAQASTALFAASGDLPVTVPLGDGPPVTYTSAPDESTVNAYRWIEGFFLAAICRDDTSLDLLCEAPIEPMRRSTSRNPEYRYEFIEALRRFWLMEGDPGELAVQAMHLTDPDRDDINNREYTLYIDVHLIRLFFFVHARDRDFGDALVHALRDHKKYWSKKDRRQLRDGILALNLIGLAVLAHDLHIPFEVDSEYLPMWLVTGEPFRQIP
jgi:hypothetical protein